MKTSISKNRIFYSLLTTVFIIIIIALVSYQKKDSQIYPSVEAILTQLWRNLTEKTAILAILSTFMRVIITLILSLLTALLIGILYYYHPESIGFLKPILVFAKCAPIAAISIYLFIIVGAKLSPYIITYLVIMPVMCEGVIASIEKMPRGIVEELALTKASRFYKFRKIYLPLMKKDILTNFLQTIGLAFKVMIMGEYLTQCKGSIGIMIYDAFTVLNMAQLLAIIVEIIIIVLIGELIVKKVEKRYISQIN